MRAEVLRRRLVPDATTNGDGHLRTGPLAAVEVTAKPTPDLVLLGAFLAVMALFGRSFAKLHLGGHLYITEPVLLAVLALAIFRVGPRGAIRRVQEVVPLAPLLILWLAGAVATLRGLGDFGLGDVSHDVGLVEYSVMLALVPLVADSRERIRLLGTVVVASSVGAILLYASYWAMPPDIAPGQWPNPDPAAAIYMSIFLVWAGARAAQGLRVRPLEWVLIALGTTLLSVQQARSSWFAMAGAMLALVILAPQRRRLRTLAAVIAIFVLSNAAAYGVMRARDAWTSAPGAASSSASAPSRGSGTTPGIIAEAVGSFKPSNLAPGANVNARWRLGISWFMLKQTAKRPLFGVGFGRPTDFKFDGVYYDRRTGNPNDPNDVTGPHDSFVNLFYRTGLLGAIPFLVLVAIALRRLRSSLVEASASHRARIVATAAGLAFISIIALLNVALEGPQMGLFFWGGLALLLLTPRMGWRAAERHGTTPQT